MWLSLSNLSSNLVSSFSRGSTILVYLGFLTASFSAQKRSIKFLSSLSLSFKASQILSKSLFKFFYDSAVLGNLVKRNLMFSHASSIFLNSLESSKAQSFTIPPLSPILLLRTKIGKIDLHSYEAFTIPRILAVSTSHPLESFSPGVSTMTISFPPLLI